MSEFLNYVRFLQLIFEGLQFDEEGLFGDFDGYIEDDFVGEVFLFECDVDVDVFDRIEVGIIYVFVSVLDYGRNIICRYFWSIGICIVVYFLKN